MKYQNYQVEDFLTDESFLKYCTGSSEQDINFWENWIQEYPENAELVKEARDLYLLLHTAVKTQTSSNSELNNFKALFAAHTEKTTHPTLKTNFNRYYFRQALRYAAVVAGVILAAGLWFYNSNSVPAKKTANRVNTIENNEIKKTLVLPDGSRVLLNANSTITVDKDFGKTRRLVTLTGEAFFEVAKNARKPFIVKSGNTLTTALGTSFMVRYYQHESEVKVSLVTGKVKVEHSPPSAGHKSASVFLSPGLQVVINEKATDQILEKKPFEINGIELWKQDLLAFEGAEFSEVTSKLEEWYGVKITVVNGPEKTKHFTGDFKNKSLANVLEALSFAHKFHYSIDSSQVRIEF